MEEKFVLIIKETGRNSLKEEAAMFNRIEKDFESLEDVKNFIVERYGKMPSRKAKVYVDTKDGKSRQVGFCHSYWNKDWSHNMPSWYQTDWVEVIKIKEDFERIII